MFDSADPFNETRLRKSEWYKGDFWAISHQEIALQSDFKIRDQYGKWIETIDFSRSAAWWSHIRNQFHLPKTVLPIVRPRFRRLQKENVSRALRQLGVGKEIKILVNAIDSSMLIHVDIIPAFRDMLTDYEKNIVTYSETGHQEWVELVIKEGGWQFIGDEPFLSWDETINSYYPGPGATGIDFVKPSFISDWNGSRLIRYYGNSKIIVEKNFAMQLQELIPKWSVFTFENPPISVLL